MRVLLLYCFLVLPGWCSAQFTYVQDTTVPVSQNNKMLAMPWAGGLNATQYNTLDLNGDGKDDLVLFDRMANKIITFVNKDNQYKPAPAYETLFPKDVINFLILRDVNCDGKKDLFTGNTLGIKVYLNVTEAGGLPVWKHRIFYTGSLTGKSDVILSKGSALNNLQVLYDDLPAILDVDGDGDLDIFAIRFAGNGTIEFHKNLSSEKLLSCDSIVFERVTSQWGGVTECTCGNFAFNGDACPTGGKTEHAGGKSLLMLDVTNDGKVDAILSEAACSRLSLLENKGTIDIPLINDYRMFPSANVNNLLYPSAYYEDVDADGIKDLITSTNLFVKPDLWVSNPDYTRSNWFYKNTGSNTNPSFGFVKPDFLQDQMIDVGDNAIPALVDWDRDGDYDLFVSHHTSDVMASKIRLYENSGTSRSPNFILKDDDFLNFSSLSQYNLKIQFADITNDGRQDLVFTATDFNDLRTRLRYLPNQSATGFAFSLGDIEVIDIDPAAPNELASTENITVVDVDQDGITDLLQGRSNGALYYWRNKGAMSYSLANNQYLDFKSSVERQNLASAVGDLDADGTLDLILGDQTGEVTIIGNFRKAKDATAASKNVIWNSLTENYEPKNLGGRIWPTVVDLFESVRPSLMIGNVLGGLSILRHDNEGVLPEQPVISLYPNPVLKNAELLLAVDRPVQYQVISSKGQLLFESSASAGKSIVPINTLSAGVYILRVLAKGKPVAHRFVVY